MIKILFLIAIFFSPLPAYAQWYLGQASLPINKNNYNDVRKSVIEKAIENASLQASSYIKVETTVSDGILTKNSSHILSEHHISEIKILNESVANDTLTINVKVNLRTGLNCNKDQYLKQIIIAQFPLLTAAQATAGDIYTLPFHVASRFKNELINQPNIFVEELIPQMVFKPDSSMDTIDLQSINRISHALSSRYQSQYLVFGYIRDISLFNETKSGLLTSTTSPLRNFTIKIYMYDRITDSIVLEHEYHGEGGWSFNSFNKVDLANSLFWRSEYGKTITDTLFKAAKEINQTLSCDATKATVINKDNEFITINIGTLHGVKIGDMFQYSKLKNVLLNNTILTTLMPPNNPTYLEVVQVSNKISLLRVPPKQDVNGIKQHQIDLYDVVTTVPH
ncbi:flagella assembly protein FlgT middle domain-containing protein [Shewanella sp. A14]